MAEKDASVVKVTAQQSPEQQQRNLAGDRTYTLVMATPGAIVRKTAERGGRHSAGSGDQRVCQAGAAASDIWGRGKS